MSKIGTVLGRSTLLPTLIQAVGTGLLSWFLQKKFGSTGLPADTAGVDIAAGKS